MLFAPLDMHGEKRADIHRANRLSMLHDRVVKRMDKVDQAADEVEQAAAVLVDVTRRSAVEAFREAICGSSSAAFLQG
ncbi:hypothetical protein ACWGTI_03395 [Mesorhizobium sp. ArgA1]